MPSGIEERVTGPVDVGVAEYGDGSGFPIGALASSLDAKARGRPDEGCSAGSKGECEDELR